ncbi:MAG: UvrD-helicase domain-containing protein [Actinobacteria bacterium]|nr:UvrD-helicase domain-containing protein [Actinomycetota bacterium]
MSSDSLRARAQDFLADLGTASASIELPAGCGKTEAAVALTAAAVNVRKRVLLLTHTNAGVTAIRRRLTKHGVDGPVTVTTIDSFMQRLATSFPSLGPELGVDETHDKYWLRLRAAAVSIAGVQNIRDVLESSYDFVIVDEYQDCSVEQHELVLALAERIPTVILGDPLQAIFGFGGNILIPWDDVVTAFPAAEPFEIVPHRWRETNPDLGEWLLSEVRPALRDGSEIDLGSAAAIVRGQSDAQARLKVPWRYVDWPGPVLFVAESPWQAEAFAKSTKGNFPVLEDLGMRNVMRLATELDEATAGTEFATVVLKFILGSTTRVGEALGGGPNAVTRLVQGRRFAPRQLGPNADLQHALNDVIDNPGPTTVLEAMALAHALPDTSCFAEERFRDARDVVGIVERGECRTYRDAATAVRGRKRFSSRRDRRATAHPGLVKGLEFDVCVVLDADGFQSATHLYVALTRGSTTLHLLSSNNALRPSC